MGSGSANLDRTVVLASADAVLRQRLRSSLSGLRWQVREARGGAEAMAQLEDLPTEALLLDNWLPDLEIVEFAEQISAMYPGMELLRVDGDPIAGGTKSPRRHELLHALREASGAALRVASAPDGSARRDDMWTSAPLLPGLQEEKRVYQESIAPGSIAGLGEGVSDAVQRDVRARPTTAQRSLMIDDLVGESAVMIELAHIIRLVAPRKATVLIEGETGTGKEVVARALHSLSPRSAKPFVVLNCAAIPEALLEAELFGHTRGAFTGAVQSRTGRIEAAHGGTLFLDEIGEMPIALQAKMLRFLESGELQRVGDNETMKVDVRVIAATHQHLEQRSSDGSFRLDLYHRLAVFPVDVPPLRDRVEDIPLLCEHFLACMGETSPRKTLSNAALDKLCLHDWPGNVRELAHVLERASILAEDSPSIRFEDVRLRRAPRK